MRVRILIALTMMFLVALPLQAQDSPVSSEQILSISTLPPLDPPPTGQDIIDAFALANSAGLNGDFISKRWSELEPSSGDFQLDELANNLEYVENTYGYSLFLGIQVINITAKETPADLLDVAFDDPQMIERFKALFDAILPHLTENVRYLSIGNEVDVYLNANPDAWTTYKNFYDQVIAYVHEAAPWMQVGVTVTFDGAVGSEAKVARLNEKSDVFILTYYPFGEMLTVRDPASPLDDFPRMVTLAGERPLILQEVGYPSAELLDSSEQKQADFVSHVFEAWAAAGDDIVWLNYFLLHDFSEELCSAFETYYALPNERFHAMLCSLGLRESNGTPRLGWDAFLQAGQEWAGRESR